MKIISFFTLVLLTCCQPGCKPKAAAPKQQGLVDVNLVQPVENADWSKILALRGFVPLSTPEPFKIIANILFAEDKIITLDVETDFSAIRVFDGKTGAYLYDIGKRLETDDPEKGYFGVSDIAYNPDQKRLRLLSNGQQRLTDYDLSGKYLGSTKYDFYGSDLAYLGNDEWVVYNEHDVNEKIGRHYLVFYNSNGEISHKSMPYEKSQDGHAFNFAGYLKRSGNEVWFNAPFNDTVYSVSGTQAMPRYRVSASGHSNTGGMNAEVSLEEGFFSNGRYVVFPFQNNLKLRVGMYDNEKNLFMDSQHLDKNVLFNKLFVGFRVFTKDEKTFALLLGKDQLQRFLPQNDKAEWEKLAPGLYDQVMNDADASGKQYLLFFGFKG